MNIENNIIQDNKETNSFHIRELLEQYFYYWKWFVLGMILCIAGAYVYLRYSTPQYKVEAKVLILDESNSMTGELAALQDLSILSCGARTNVEDQMEILRSRRLMMEVAKKLKLNIRYFKEG